MPHYITNQFFWRWSLQKITRPPGKCVKNASILWPQLEKATLFFRFWPRHRWNRTKPWNLLYTYKYGHIYIYIWALPPKDLPILFFFTGIYVVLQQFCVFLQIFVFWKGVCLEPNPTPPKKTCSLHVSIFLLFILKKTVPFLKKRCPYIISFSFWKKNCL